MGLLSALGINNKKESVQAQYAPAVMGDSLIGFGYNTFGAGPMDRTLATQVPAVNSNTIRAKRMAYAGCIGSSVLPGMLRSIRCYG